MHPSVDFAAEKSRPEFWALVKLVSQILKYSTRKRKTSPSRVKTYTVDEISRALERRGLAVDHLLADIERVAAYSVARGEMLHSIEPRLMNRERARDTFLTLAAVADYPRELVVWNKQSGEKRHEAYLTSIVNILTYRELTRRFGEPHFVANPRGPLTFAREGRPLRTLFRWMDGAYPDVNHPVAAWEIKEYYGTTTFGSRVADGVYESALDGYELNDLRAEGIDVRHYLFVDDYFTWWQSGKSFLCRIIDMLHSGLLDAAFFGDEVLTEWPREIATWPPPD